MGCHTQLENHEIGLLFIWWFKNLLSLGEPLWGATLITFGAAAGAIIAGPPLPHASKMSRSEVFWICRSTLIGQIMSSCFGILESVCFPNCNWVWFKTNSCFVLSCNESNMTDGAAVSILLLSSWTNWWGPTNLVACFALMKVGMYWRTRYFHLWAVRNQWRWISIVKERSRPAYFLAETCLNTEASLQA